MKITDVLSMSPQTLTVLSLMNLKVSPETGDNSMLVLWFALLCVSGCAMVVLAICGKKKFWF